MVGCCSKQTPAWNIAQLALISLSFCGLTMMHLLPKLAHYYIRSASTYVLYYIAMVVLCVPLMYVQLRLGGKMRKGVVGVMGTCFPILKGAGIAALIFTSIYLLYNSYFVALTAIYAFTALDQPYEWSKPANLTHLDPFLKEKLYLQNEVLEMSASIDDTGKVFWWLAVAVTGVWAVTWLCIFGGMRILGYVMSIFGLVAMAITIALMAYGREELLHSGSPEKDFYKADWDTAKEPSLKDAFLDTWIPLINLVVLMMGSFFGIFPTIGKCTGPSTAITHLSWLPVFLVVCAMPHLFVNMLAPYLEALALKLGIPVYMVIAATGFGSGDFLVLVPKILSALQMKKGVAFVWFFMIFLYTIMPQALLSAVVVDNLVEYIHTFSKRFIRYRSIVFAIVSFLFCAVGIALTIPLITQGGSYFVQLIGAWQTRGYGFLAVFFVIAIAVSYARQSFHICNKITFIIWVVLAGLFSAAVLIYDAEFQSEIEDFVGTGLDGAEYTYPKWAYAIGWLICLGPTALGLLIGAIHSCCTAQSDNRVSEVFKGKPVPADSEQEHNAAAVAYKAPPSDDYIESDSLRKY